LVVISPYFIWNYSVFGHLTPISGSIKSTFPALMTEGKVGVTSLPFLIPLLIVILYLLVSFITKRSRYYKEVISSINERPQEKFILALTLGAIIHLLWTRLYMSFGVYQWHFIAYVPTIAYFISYILSADIRSDKTGHNPLKQRLVLVSLLVVNLVYNSYLTVEKGVHHAERIVAAEWVKENIHEDDGLALSDAGVFAYFNERITVNLDGLINSYEFQDAIISDEFENFLSKSGVKYVADAYAYCDKPKHKIIVRGWRGKNIETPVGYSLEADRDNAIFVGKPHVHRPLTKKRQHCFTIWNINDVSIKRFDFRI
jgi:hypothetical protein